MTSEKTTLDKTPKDSVKEQTPAQQDSTDQTQKNTSPSAEKDNKVQYSDDLFPDFKSLSIGDDLALSSNYISPEHELLHHVDRYQSLQNQLHSQLRSSFIQLSKYNIQKNSPITIDENEHKANKVISITTSPIDSNTVGTFKVEIESSDSDFKPLTQAMVFPSLQLRETAKGFDNSLKDVTSVINERVEVMRVLHVLERKKKQTKKKLKEFKKVDVTEDVVASV